MFCQSGQLTCSCGPCVISLQEKCAAGLGIESVTLKSAVWQTAECVMDLGIYYTSSMFMFVARLRKKFK